MHACICALFSTHACMHELNMCRVCVCACLSLRKVYKCGSACLLARHACLHAKACVCLLRLVYVCGQAISRHVYLCL